jgi:hypothetical protein
MAHNRVPLVKPNPMPEYTRQDTTPPATFTGEIPKVVPNIPPEYIGNLLVAINPPTINNSGNIPNVSPNPMPEYLDQTRTAPTPLADTNGLT